MPLWYVFRNGRELRCMVIQESPKVNREGPIKRTSYTAHSMFQISCRGCRANRDKTKYPVHGQSFKRGSETAKIGAQ